MSSHLSQSLLLLLQRQDCPLHILYIHAEYSYNTFHTTNFYQLKSITRFIGGKIWPSLSSILFFRSVSIRGRRTPTYVYPCFESTVLLAQTIPMFRHKFNAHLDLFIRSLLRDGWQIENVAVLKKTYSLIFPLNLYNYLKMVILAVASENLSHALGRMDEQTNSVLDGTHHQPHIANRLRYDADRKDRHQHIRVSQQAFFAQHFGYFHGGRIRLCDARIHEFHFRRLLLLSFDCLHRNAASISSSCPNQNH